MSDVFKNTKIRVLGDLSKEYELLAKYNGGPWYDKYCSLEWAINTICENDKKIEKITSILKSAKADPTRDEYAEYYLDRIEEVLRWTPT